MDTEERIRLDTLETIRDYFRDWERNIRASRKRDDTVSFTLGNIEDGLSSIWIEERKFFKDKSYDDSELKEEHFLSDDLICKATQESLDYDDMNSIRRINYCQFCGKRLRDK